MSPADRSGPEHPDAKGPPGDGDGTGGPQGSGDAGDDAAGGGPRRGGRPSLGPRKGFPLRLPPKLMEQLRGWANQDMRSLNAQIEFLLRDALRRRRGGDDAADGD